MHFRELPQLEQAIGQLKPLADVAALTKSAATCQAMVVRRLAVPEPGIGACSYLVAYEGPAEDPRAWHAHYLAHHPGLMAQLPGIRELEIYTPVEWVAATPWRRVEYLQRNKVVFDSPAALDAALNSPIRHSMRDDFARFPRYSGAVTHYPMLSFDPWS